MKPLQVLSNFEVYTMLKDQHINRSQSLMASTQAADFQDLYTVEFETISYLEKILPCSQMSMESVARFLKKLKDFNLTKAEKLTLLNFRPTTTVDLHMHIEECENRFDDKGLEKIISVVRETLPLSNNAPLF